MAILDASGRPIQSTAGAGDYAPENMAVFATLVNKVSDKPELTFQVVFPLENFEHYQEEGAHFTLVLHNFIGMAYGTQILKVTEYDEDTVAGWVEEVSQKYSVALSEPLPLDTIFRDAATVEQLKSLKGVGENDNEEAAEAGEAGEEGEGSSVLN